jgi:hypothetical protein
MTLNIGEGVMFGSDRATPANDTAPVSVAMKASAI